MKHYLRIINLLPLFIIFIGTRGQELALHKTFLTVEEGLSHNEVTSIVQDQDGFIWIGTRGGLNRYDGYEFKIFNQVPGDTNSLVNPSVESLFVDSKGNLWIGTKSGGVSKYNSKTGQFQNFIYNYNHKNEILSDNRILSFSEDKHGRIWMGTRNNGLVIYDAENDSVSFHLKNEAVNTILSIPKGGDWVGTNHGLYKYNEKSGTFEKIKLPFDNFYCQELKFDEQRNVIWVARIGGLYQFDPNTYDLVGYKIEGESAVSNVPIHNYYSTLLDDRGRVWVGTWGTGSYIFYPDLKEFKRYLVYPENRLAFNKDYDTILDVFQDRDNNIWLGTNGGGVCLLTPKLEFKAVGYHPEPYKGLVNTRIMSVVDDKNGNLWIGTIGSGLFWSPNRETFLQVDYPHNTRESQFFVIKYLYEDKSGNVWAGSNRGTFKVEFREGMPKLVNIFENLPEPPFDNSNQFISILEASGMLLFGSLENGLFLVDKNDNYKLLKHFTRVDESTEGLSTNRISYLLLDSKDNIWIGTYDGLHVFNPVDSTVQLAKKVFQVKGELTGNIITCMNEDESGNLWIGTPNGLNRLIHISENSYEIKWYTEEDGLASNFIKGISHDSQGNLWVSTNTGISKFTMDKLTFTHFTEADGVLGKNFSEASVFRNRKGEIFFGGTQGLTYFKPEDILEKFSANKPVLTDFKINNQILEPGQEVGSNVLMEESIAQTKKLRIPYRYNNFEIGFSAMDYKAVGKNHYAYKLENHDQDWNYIGTRRFINFNNLRKGDYVLRIKSSDSHNYWNEEPTELAITILPPFWQTWYALIFYILLITSIVLLIRWNSIKQIRLVNTLEKEKILHEQDQRISELKFQFFTNISHEFRTPLTLMIAPLKEILNKTDAGKLTKETAHKIEIVYLNALRLMKLVNQLLEFRKSETGNMKLSARYTDVEDFVNEVTIPFYELAKINNITFKVKSSLQTKYIWFDREKLELILNNLISNAFKKVKENEKIELSLSEGEGEILISVSDNGPGIKATEIGHIFERFYRVEKEGNYGSSGIGLALTKRLVELHKGSISVSSVPKVHTEFTVALLKGNNHLKEEEMVTSPATVHPSEQATPSLWRSNSINLRTKNKEGKQILVVEDNQDILEYLTSLLQPLYLVETATNGMEGYKKAVELKPDLILSDIMMPEIDGFEFCKKVKSHAGLSTIPFVYLTAKNEEQHKLFGIRTGADDYISKPFDPEYLLYKIENLIIIKEKIKKQYSKTVRLEPSEIDITSSDQVFLEKIMAIVEKNLDNSVFTSEMLAKEMSMSNSTLYRKLKELTNSSTAEFIRTIRIKRAAQLLKIKDKTVTEIAYEVGFNDVKHFRTIFQKHFGSSPTVYRSKI